MPAGPAASGARQASELVYHRHAEAPTLGKSEIWRQVVEARDLLGARACRIGRPYLYGLAASGQAGVEHALEIFRSELRRALALVGCPRLGHLGRRRVRTPAIR